MVQFSPSSATDVELLSHLRLGFYPPLNAIFCPTCQTIVPKDKVFSHVTNRHKWTASAARPVTDSVQTKIDAVASNDIISLNLQTGPRLQFLKAPVRGRKCSECLGLFLSDTAMRSHLKSTGHKRDINVSIPLVQCLYREVGRQNILYEVSQDSVIHLTRNKTTTTQADQDGIVTKHIDWITECFERSRIKETIALNTSEAHVRMTPWLIFTNWPSFFEGEDLTKMIENIPTMKEVTQNFPDMVDVLKSIFQSSIEVLGQLSPEMRLLIRGQEGKSVSKPVRLIGKDTFLRYTTPIIQLFAMMVTGIEYNTLEGLKFDSRYIPEATFKLSKYLYSDISDSESDNEERLGEIRRLCRSILNDLVQTPLVNKFNHSPIAVMMSYLGLDEHRGVCSFKEPFAYTSTISGFLYTVRLIVVENVFQDILNELPFDDTEMQGTSGTILTTLYDHVESALIMNGQLGLLNEKLLQARGKYLSMDSPTVFRCIVNFLNYGRAHADVPIMPRISWSDDNRTIFFEEKQITIAGFRTMVRSELITMDNMVKDVFGLDGCPEIDQGFLDRTHTGFTCRTSFIEKAKDSFPKVVIEAVRSGGADRFGLSNSQRGCIVEQVSYFRRTQKSVTKYLKLLAFLVHVTSGQPSRGPEILGVRIQGSNGENPNIFNDGGRICMVTTYHKSQSVQDSHRLVLRYIPFPVARHLVIYLLYLRPLVNIQREIEGFSPLPSTLFAVLSSRSRESDNCRLLRTEDLTEQIAASSEAHIGERLTVSSYRHIAPAIVRRHLEPTHASFLCLDGMNIGQEEDGLDIFEEQAAHRADTGRAIYAIDTAIGYMSETNTGKWRAASKAWHDFIFQTGFFSNAHHNFGTSKRTKSVTEEHMPFTAERTDSTESTINTSLIAPARELSMGFKHCFTDTTLQSLYQLTGGFSYKSIRQMESMEAVLSGEKIVIVTLETGGGKTLLLFLPLRMPNARISVYIAPLLALTHDMSYRATAAHIPNLVYTEEHVRQKEVEAGGIPAGTLIIASQDQVGHEGFKKFIKRLVSRDMLDRVIVDEAHLTATELEYRDSISDISWLVNCSVQLVLLSGTLPPFVVTGLGDIFGFDPLKDACLLRYPTVRPNITYDIVHPKDDTPVTMEKICAFLNEKFFDIPDLDSVTDRAILYCQTARDAKKVAQKLGCHVYVGSEKDYAARKSTLEDWRRGLGANLTKPQFIVATKALGAGIDVPHVRLVVHWNAPTSLIDYVQESGRAGRSLDGLAKPAWAYLVTKSKGLPNTFGNPYRVVFPFGKPLVELPSYIAMKQYIRSTQCMRATIHSFLDGMSVRCSNDPAYKICGNCATRFQQLSSEVTDGTNPTVVEMHRALIMQNSEASIESNRQMRVERQRKISRLTSFRELALSSACCICIYLGDHRGSSDDHITTNCSHIDKEMFEVVERVHLLMVEMYEPKLACFTCHFTHPICREWEECDTEPIAILIFFAAVANKMTQLPAKCQTEMDVAKYLATTRTIGGWKTTQLVMVLDDLLSKNWFSEQ